MSLSSAAVEPEIARPGSAKTELTCLSDILSQDAGAIGVPSHPYKAQNSVFETSQAMNSMVRTHPLRRDIKSDSVAFRGVGGLPCETVWFTV